MPNKISPTDEQVKAMQMAIEGKSMSLAAFAGGGKTSTLKLIAFVLGRQSKRGLYLAFNADIAKEAATKMTDNVECRTFHSLALSNAPAHIRKRLKQEYPIWEFESQFNINRVVIEVAEKEIDVAKFAVGKLEYNVTKVQNVNIVSTTQKRIIDNALSYFMRSQSDEFDKSFVEMAIKRQYEDILPDSLEMLTNLLSPIAKLIWEDYLNPKGVIGIGDKHDVYLKIWAMSNPVINTDFILFDEAQDADPIMTKILANQTCQIIYVGDPYQQIYSWRGAVNVMQSLKVSTSYLTQSFRFGVSLANACQPILKYLGCTQTIHGLPTINTVVDRQNENPFDFDVLLCRTNAGVIQACLSYQEKDVMVLPVNVDLKATESMMAAIRELQTTGRTDHRAIKGFTSYNMLLEYAENMPDDINISAYVRLYKRFDYAVIRDLLAKCRNIGDAKKGQVKFATTAHKSKGLEWDSVLIHDDFNNAFIDKNGNAKSNIVAEECRLLYVAMTRAKKQLYLKRVAKSLDVFN